MRFIILLTLILWPSIAWAKYESSSNDAASIVLYGYDGTTLRPISVLADGTVEVV